MSDHFRAEGASDRAGAARMTLMVAVLFTLVGVFVARVPVLYKTLTGGFTFEEGIVEVRDILEAEAVEPVDNHALQGAAIAGMLDSLGDDYAQYVSPEEQREFEKSLTSNFVGIGVQVMPDGTPGAEYLTVVSPLEDTPAYRAGIQAGDKIAEIDGTSTRGLTVDECIKLLTGEPGTSVSLKILRPRVIADGKAIEATTAKAPEHSATTPENTENPGTGVLPVQSTAATDEPKLAGDEELSITLERAVITSRSVRGISRVDNGDGQWDYLIDHDRRIAYIRLAQFTPSAAEEFVGALFEAGADKPGFGGLIIDLRDNPGGMIDAAIAIADFFLDSGTIVSTRGRAGIENHVYTAKTGDTFPEFSVIVMLNGQSASASEMLAGALKDHRRALILGTRSYGKGLVQTVKTPPMLNGAQIKFTAARYYLPSGKLIQRTDDAHDWGVDPDDGFYVPMTDAQRLAAFRKRRDADILRQRSELNGTRAQGDAAALKWHDPAWIKEQMSDVQLGSALTAMQSRLDGASAEWTPVAPLGAQHGRLALDELKTLEEQYRQLLKALETIARRTQALREAAEHGEDPAEHAAARQIDLWPDAELVGGVIEIKNADGRVVATLPITEDDLEQRLIDAGVTTPEEAKP